MKSILFIVGLISFVLFLSPHVFAEFNEFKNYFQELNPEVAELKIELVLSSALRRLEIPYLEEDQIRTQGFFEKLENKIKEKDANAQIFISGGTVRSMLGYIYSEVYRMKQKHPHLTTSNILDSMSQSKERLLTFDTLGIGSDLDILVIPSTHSANLDGNIYAAVKEFINSARNKFNIASHESSLAAAFVPEGDVKDYEDQMNNAVNQGGSSLDWLAFPINGGKMKLPPRDPDVFKRFIAGEYDYLPPADLSQVKPEYRNQPEDIRIIRGLRPLLEIPFLHLSKSGVEQMKPRLEELLKRVKNDGESLSYLALAQFKKMMRNGRFEGAHNRFYIPDGEIEKLALQISKTHQGRESKLPLIPEYILNQNPRLRKGRDNCNLEKGKLLLSLEEFNAKYTDNGVLYHGTPRIENILSIIRNGFAVSDELQLQGSSYFGRGVYSTSNKKFAETYGIPIEFKLKSHVYPRILDWSIVKEKEEMKHILEKASHNGIDGFQYLAEKCDVDIIINTHVLIENSGVIRVSKNMEKLIEIHRSKLENSLSEYSLKPNDPDAVRSLVASALGYEPLTVFGTFLGIKDLKPFSLADHALHWLKYHTNEDSRFRGEYYLENTQIVSSELYQQIVRLLKDPNSDARRVAVRFLGKNGVQDVKIQMTLISMLVDQEIRVRMAVHDTLGNIFKSHEPDPTIIEYLKNLLTSSDPMDRISAIRSWDIIGPTDPSVLLSIVSLLKDEDARVRYSTVHNLDILLSKYQSDEIIVTVQKFLSECIVQDSDPGVRKRCVDVLGKTRPKDPMLHQVLAKALTDPDVYTVMSAAKILKVVRTTDPTIHLALVNSPYFEAKRKYSRDLVKEIGTALKKIKPTDPRVHFALAELLVGENKDKSRSAADVILSLGPLNLTDTKTNSSEFIELLVKLLYQSERSSEERKAACRILKFLPFKDQILKRGDLPLLEVCAPFLHDQ